MREELDPIKCYICQLVASEGSRHEANSNRNRSRPKKSNRKKKKLDEVLIEREVLHKI
jgi:hypothetical protein